MEIVEIFAEIQNVRYTPRLGNTLPHYSIFELERALEESGSFYLELGDENKVAVSRWVSPKRTRSYPYARVYDTLQFLGKRVTIIPVIKDEGIDGDRDFIQWDTVSLMSLLNVYTIIGYYIDADRNRRYENKITNQRFDVNYIREKIEELASYQYYPLCWNMEQLEDIYTIATKALDAYKKISEKLGVQMHSLESAKQRIRKIYGEILTFKKDSRRLAMQAQRRESLTVQPKESVQGIKGRITITNHLGGYYYFTCDEVEMHGDKLYLIEAKHTKEGLLPSVSDIKDGLLKMILYTNLSVVSVGGKEFKAVPILKLTTNREFDENLLASKKKKMFNLLKEEARTNKFKLKINDEIVA